MPDISSLYPQPPGPSQNALTGDPSKLLGMMQQLNQLQAFGKTFTAKKAIGEAYSRNLNPDGTPNLSGIARELRNNPDASFGLPEATSTILDQHSKVIANDTAAFEQYAKHSDFAQQWLARRANQPNFKTEDLLNDAVAISRNTDPRAVPSSVIGSVISGVLNDPAGPHVALQNLANRVMGAGAAATPVTAAPGAAGQPQQMPLGAAGYGAGARPTGLPPGEAEAAVEAAGRASRLQATGATTAQYHADLDNLKQDSKVLDNLGGPTTDVEKKLNQLSQRVGGFGVTLDKDQLRALESFDKIANQISLNQSQMFHGSDAGLHTVVGANPSTSMSRYGRDGVIDMLQGNQDAIDVTRKAWLSARAKGAPAQSYDTFINEFSNHIDPRVFQFNRLSRENQQKFLSQMDPQDMGEFEQRYQTAIQNKWVKPLKGAPNAAQ